MQYDASANPSKQELLRKFVDIHVIHCQTLLVQEKVLDIDEVENLFYTESELLDMGYPDVETAINDGADIKEVYEWWLVDEWFADRLNEHEEPLIRNEYGTWWGRTCTGQAIYIDCVIEAIYDGCWR